MNEYLTLDTHELLELTGDNLAVRAYEDMWDDRADQMSALHRRLAAHERIVAGLRGVPSPSAQGDGLPDGVRECVLCSVQWLRRHRQSHAPDCPWRLAQQTKGSEQ